MKRFNVSYVILIFIVSLNLRLGISSVPPIQKMIQESLMLSNFEISLLTGIPVVCMGIFAFLVARVQKQFGRERSIFYLLLFLGIMTLLRGVANNYSILVITTFGIGFSIAIIGPLLSGFIKKEFPNHTSILIAVYSFAMGTGSLIVSNLTSVIADKTGNNWKLALAFWGILSIIACFIWKIFAKDNGEKELNETVEKIDYKDWNLWKMILFFGIQSGIFYSFSMYLIPFLKSEGIDENTLITLLTLFVGLQMFFGFFIPVLMHKFGTIRSWSIFCTLSLVIGIVIPLLSQINLVLALIIILLVAVGLGGSFPLAMLMPLDYSHNPDEASIVTSIVQAFGYILGGIVPMVFGIIVDKTTNYNGIFYIMAFGSLILFLIGFSRIKNKNI